VHRFSGSSPVRSASDHGGRKRGGVLQKVVADRSDIESAFSELRTAYAERRVAMMGLLTRLADNFWMKPQ
jgi:hypothetical protein